VAWLVYIKRANFESQNAWMSTTRRQGRIWILTIPAGSWGPPVLPESCSYIKGQQEIGNQTGYHHWQLVVYFRDKVSLTAVKRSFCTEMHAELTRGPAAEGYVFKDDTAVDGTRFELGTKPVCRSSKVDWERVWTMAQSGHFNDIPAQIRVTSYSSLRRIRSDYARPAAIMRECYVYWGATGTGKSRRAWDEAGLGAFPKNPTTKFWDGYLDHEVFYIN